MHKYNEQEAILQKWKKMLLQLAENSEKKRALLEIINSEKKVETRLLEFNSKREAILKGDTEEEESFFSWLWSVIVSIFCFCWPQNPSTELEELLLEKIHINPSRLSGNSSDDEGAGEILEDADYEDALFSNPERAFADIQRLIKFLPANGDKINNIIERLDAIKYLLTVGTYQTLLSRLYKKFPLETLNYYYQSYCEEPEKFIGPEEFLEQELMSRALMDLFILPLDTDPLNQRCFAIQELLLIIALSNVERPPLTLMLADAIKNNTKEWELFRHLGSGYARTKSQILDLMPESKAHLKNSTLILMKVIELQAQKNFPYQPLFLNLTRLACQELLLNYHQFPEQQANHVLHQTIELLSSEILGTWSSAKKERKIMEKLMTERTNIHETIFSMAECCAILSIYSHTQMSEFNYQRAVFYANQLIMASLAGEKELVSQAEEFCNLEPHEEIWVLSVINGLELHGFKLTEDDLLTKAEKFFNLEPQELSWMLKVIKQINPDGPKMAETISSIIVSKKEDSNKKSQDYAKPERQLNNSSTSNNPNRFSGRPLPQIPQQSMDFYKNASFGNS
jgi:hypothetical protein